MAKKKAVKPIEVLEQVLPDKLVSIQEPEEPKEKLLEVTVEMFFVDGNLGAHFAEYGYDVEWPKDQVRKIPRWLVDRCKQSGADIIDAR